MQYHKLVRDRIPEIIESDGKICDWETLSDADYLSLLEEKLNEELAEYQQSKSLEELADLLEVMQAVLKARGWTWDELEQVRAKKAEKRGGFEKKILLKSVISGSSASLSESILENQEKIFEKLTPRVLQKYIWLQENLHQRNIAVDAEYRQRFAGFFRMRFVSSEYKDNFFSLFEQIKKDDSISFRDVSEQLYKVSGKHEFSFISKMLHMINPSRPIYDSQVDSVLHIHRTYRSGLEGKISGDEMILKRISSVYQTLCASQDIVSLLDIIDQSVPGHLISKEKKIDFLLWALGSLQK